MPQHRRSTVCITALLLLLWACPSAPAQERVLYDRPSPFNRIIVREDHFGMRELSFGPDGATQSAMDTKDPNRLVLAYARTSMTTFAFLPNPQRILIVGLGGGSMPMFLRRAYPQTHIDIAELDPGVAEAAKRFFNFREDQRMKVHIGDGRKFIETTSNRYDLIFLDAYGENSIPYSLATREFLQAVRSKLAEGGIVASNVWGEHSNSLYFSMLKTYLAVFDELHVIHAPASGNRILVALPRKSNLDKRQLARSASNIQKTRMPQLDLAGLIETGYQEGIELPADAKVLVDADAPKD